MNNFKISKFRILCNYSKSQARGNFSKSQELTIHTEVPKYYTWIQLAVTRVLGLPAGRLAGCHTDAAPKHSLCYFCSVSE